MIHVGLDVHQSCTQVCTIDDTTGEIVSNVPVLTAQVFEHLATLTEIGRVVLESGGESWFVALRLQSSSLPVVVVDAHKAKRQMECLSTAKTDKLNARDLAWLSHKGLLEHMSVWLPDEVTLTLRKWTRLREDLTADRTRTINQLRGELRSLGLVCEAADMDSAKARRWYEQVEPLLPADAAAVLALRWQHLYFLNEQLAGIDQRLQELVAVDPVCQRLRSLPGCGTVLSATLRAEIGEISRFPTPGHLRSYAGLTPRVFSSGDRLRHGPLDKRGNPHLRRALILLSQLVARSRGWQGTRLRRRHWNDYRRLGCNPAKVVLARGLVDLIHLLLTRGLQLDWAQLAA